MLRTVILRTSLLLLGLTPGLAPGQDFARLYLEPLTGALSRATSVTHAGDDRLFITLQDGRIVIFADGQLHLETPFLDIRDRTHTGFVEGLLSVAFHPQYASNGTFYVFYTDARFDAVVSRFRTGSDPNQADAASEAVLFRIARELPQHYGGQLQFGPDGYLYLSSGDSGGRAIDGVERRDEHCQAQADTSLLGKLLRVDADPGLEDAPFFVVPDDNPFVGQAGFRDEVWAKGLRNPWRFSFDRATGDLYLADVGHDQREEVNLQPAASPGGENYGWKMMEGTLCTGDNEGCSAPQPGCGAAEYTPPAFEYDHGAGCSITGGYVYRGSLVPELVGFYVFGDYCSGRIWAAGREGDEWRLHRLPVTAAVVSFGEDANGEIYLLTSDSLFRLKTSGDTTCFANDWTLCLNDGRFRVQTRWQTGDGQAGMGSAAPLTPDTGYFWFFEASNVEVVVKVLDACTGPFQRFWIFASGLTNVSTRLSVFDTQSGSGRDYTNPLGQAFLPIQDTDAFATCP